MTSSYVLLDSADRFDNIFSSLVPPHIAERNIRDVLGAVNAYLVVVLGAMDTFLVDEALDTFLADVIQAWRWNMSIFWIERNETQAMFGVLVVTYGESILNELVGSGGIGCDLVACNNSTI